MTSVDTTASTRRQKWHLRLLLLGLMTAVSFESLSVASYSFLRGEDSAFGEDSAHHPQFVFTDDRVLHMTATAIENTDPTRKPLTEAQRRELQDFRQQYPSLWNNNTDAGLLEQQQSPYYYVHFGKYKYQFYATHPDDAIERKKTLYLIDREEPSLMGDLSSPRIADLYERAPKTQHQLQLPQMYPPSTGTDTWVLANPLKHPTRNHDTILLESATGNPDSVVTVTLLGRYSRYVQWMDLVTGQQWSERTENVTDPEGMPLDDLNHVNAVLVNSSGKQEIWLPCGFHNDRVNSEVSTSYARIVDVATMRIRTGPKLPIAGGACVATAVTILQQESPMICSFGGTQGSHDYGKFIEETACYDRRRQSWWKPFGNLPYGLDHGSLAWIPAGVCDAADPARIIILNFRTTPYGDAHPEMLAYDMPTLGWTMRDLQDVNRRNESKWYLFYNDTRNEWDDPKDVGRDASGTIVVNGGRQIVNFAGTYYSYYLKNGKRKRKKERLSMIRSFDVCVKEWSVIGDLGLQTFALQTVASEDLQLAITCGGEAPAKDSNGNLCFVNRFHNDMRLSNRYEQ